MNIRKVCVLLINITSKLFIFFLTLYSIWTLQIHEPHFRNQNFQQTTNFIFSDIIESFHQFLWVIKFEVWVPFQSRIWILKVMIYYYITQYIRPTWPKVLIKVMCFWYSHLQVTKFDKLPDWCFHAVSWQHWWDGVCWIMIKQFYVIELLEFSFLQCSTGIVFWLSKDKKRRLFRPFSKIAVRSHHFGTNSDWDMGLSVWPRKKMLKSPMEIFKISKTEKSVNVKNEGQNHADLLFWCQRNYLL